MDFDVDDGGTTRFAHGIDNLDWECNLVWASAALLGDDIRTVSWGRCIQLSLGLVPISVARGHVNKMVEMSRQLGMAMMPYLLWGWHQHLCPGLFLEALGYS